MSSVKNTEVLYSEYNIGNRVLLWQGPVSLTENLPGMGLKVFFVRATLYSICNRSGFGKKPDTSNCGRQFL